MVWISRHFKTFLVIGAGLTATACGGGGGGGGPGPATIGGSISGLVGTVVLTNEGGDDLTLTANGSFTFPTPVPAGQAYAVTVLSQPTGPDCTVSQGTGTAAGNPISIAVTCIGNPSTFYLPLSVQPAAGSSTGTTGLFVISSKVPGVAPISIVTGSTRAIGYAHEFTQNSDASISEGQPTALVFSSVGAAGGDHLYALDLTVNSALKPVQLGTLTFPSNGSAQNCGVIDAYENLTDPTSAIFIVAIPTDPVYLCGGGPASFHWYLVHLADTPSTPPVALPTLSAPIVPLHHANGALAGFVTVDQAEQLVFYPNATFTNPIVLETGVNGIGGVFAPLSQFTQMTANPTYTILPVESTSGAYSLVRVDDSGTLTHLYDFQGSYGAAVNDATNLYLTDSYGPAGSASERILQTPLDGSGPSLVLYQFQPADNEQYYVLGSAGSSLVLGKAISTAASSYINTQIATLPIGMPATPTVIATFPNPTDVQIVAGDLLITQTTETGTVITPTFAYSTEILRPDGSVITPLRQNSAFLFNGTAPLLEVTAVSDPSGYGGGAVSVVTFTQPSSPSLAPLDAQSGGAFTLPAGSEFVFNTPVTPTLGWITVEGATTTSQFVYEPSTNTVVSVSIPNSELSLVSAPTP